MKGFKMIMKDCMGRKLEVGQHVLYSCYGHGRRRHEKAEVILIRDKSIRIEFLGSLSYGRDKGERTNIYDTTGKISVVDREEELEKTEVLVKDNKKLERVAAKINSRFEILDL